MYSELRWPHRALRPDRGSLSPGKQERGHYGGMEELTVGAISMGLGCYLGVRSEESVLSCAVHVRLLTDGLRRESHRTTERQTQETVISDPVSEQGPTASPGRINFENEAIHELEQAFVLLRPLLDSPCLT